MCSAASAQGNPFTILSSRVCSVSTAPRMVTPEQTARTPRGVIPEVGGAGGGQALLCPPRGRTGTSLSARQLGGSTDPPPATATWQIPQDQGFPVALTRYPSITSPKLPHCLPSAPAGWEAAPAQSPARGKVLFTCCLIFLIHCSHLGSSSGLL